MVKFSAAINKTTLGEDKVTTKPSKEISRRDAIKILAAVAGAAALANIPDKWTKPGMEVGVLPAHAQTSTGLYSLAVGASDSNANFCFDLTSTVTISPATPGILMRYVITLSPGVALNSPAALTDTVATDASGIAQLIINVNTFSAGDTITVTWTFENTSDGTDSGSQVFTTVNGGC